MHGYAGVYTLKSKVETVAWKVIPCVENVYLL